MIKHLVVVAVVSALMLYASPSMGHGGGLDASGCHNEVATGGPHCHPSSSGSLVPSLISLGVLLVISGGIYLWKNYREKSRSEASLAKESPISDISIASELSEQEIPVTKFVVEF